jgi:hypothetical protein
VKPAPFAYHRARRRFEVARMTYPYGVHATVVANAVRDALGLAGGVGQLPLTPARVRALADQASADQVTADQASADQVTADQASADQASADQASADQASGGAA